MIKNVLRIEKINNKTRVPVKVDRDGEAKYESSNWIMKVLRIPVVLILNASPGRFSKILLQKFSSPRGGSADVSRWPTTYRAIEIMYTYPERHAKGKTSIFEYFWFYLLKNPQALRNRLLLTTQQLVAKIKDVAKKEERVYLLSLGCGSTRSVITALSRLNDQIKVRSKLLDLSRDAINYSQKLAEEHGIAGQLEWHRDHLQNLEKYCNANFHPDIVEMVGLLDYFTRKEAIEIVRKIYKVLAPNGWLITCNIRPNFESPFVTKGASWPMVYRTPQELAEIIIEAGFLGSDIQIIYEPLKIHGLAIAQKLLNP